MKLFTLIFGAIALLAIATPSFADDLGITTGENSWDRGNGYPPPPPPYNPGGGGYYPGHPGGGGYYPGHPGGGGYYPGHPGYPGRPGRIFRQVIRCSSNDYRLSRCFVQGRVQGAEIVNQISNIGCSRGRSWGIDRDSIWVRSGCRADFLVYFVR